MTPVFVDASCFVAQFLPADQWQESPQEARSRLGEVQLVTTDEILTGVLTGVSKGGPVIWEKTEAAVQEILRDGNIRVVPQTRPSFLDGLNRFRRRLGKAYSLQDCIAMNVMEAGGITEILTSDHNFEQEGFTILMTRNAS